MRRSGSCPKCNHDQLLHIAHVAETSHHAPALREMYLALTHVGESWFGEEKRERVGKLTATMCRSCGFTEFYVDDPQSLKPDGRYITETIGPGFPLPPR